MKLLGRITVVLAAGLAVLLGTSAAAHADTKDVISSISGAWGRFNSYGDSFDVCDTEADFVLAYLEFRYIRIDGSLQTGTHYVPGDAGDCENFDHNFGEGRTVWFHVCTDQVWPFDDKCDRWWTATA
jgi:hypothetical protein